VDFASVNFKKLTINAKAPNGGNFEIRLNGLNGKVLAKGKIDKSTGWNISNRKIKKQKLGLCDLYFISKSSERIEIDWVNFN
jgi:hypothetical protein